MRPIAFTVVLIGSILVSFTARSFAADEACTLLTQTQVSAALEVPVDAGLPSPVRRRASGWGKASLQR